MRLALPIIISVAVSTTLRAEVIYVRPDATGVGDGTSWADAHLSLATAVDRAQSGDSVWVAAGTYAGPVSLKRGVQVIGGFIGDEVATTAADPIGRPTYISGEHGHRAVMAVDCDDTALLRGFHIVDGRVDTRETGAGLYLKNCDARIVECTFSRNIAEAIGGAVANWGGSPVFVNCAFTDNASGWTAGAIINRKSGSPVFVNCLFARNSSMEGGAVSVVTGAPEFINCTFARNTASKGKGGAIFDARGNAALHNCIVWGNQAASVDDRSIHSKPGSGKRATVTHSNIDGGWTGEGNISADPMFVDADQGNFRIQSGSPCVGLGLATFLPSDLVDIDRDGNRTEPLPRDLGMNPRFSGTAVDMGAYGSAGP